MKYEDEDQIAHSKYQVRVRINIKSSYSHLTDETLIFYFFCRSVSRGSQVISHGIPLGAFYFSSCRLHNSY